MNVKLNIKLINIVNKYFYNNNNKNMVHEYNVRYMRKYIQDVSEFSAQIDTAALGHETSRKC